MSKMKKIAILAIIAMVLTMIPAALFAATADSTRLEGAGRVETALDIASAGWTTASTVILAPADQANLVDALASAPLAGQENAPILLTFKGSLDAAVKDKITALGATKVYVIGAISDAVAAEVDAISGVTVETLKGDSRWGTADAVNAKLMSPAGTFVVGYDAIADALSVASYAAANKYKIVLANADGTVDSAKLVGTKYIVGGTTLVKDIAGATRLSGPDRFATNSDVASKLGFTYSRVYVANGLSLVDALAVAPLAAKYGAFVVLSSANSVASIPGVTSATKVVAVGGTGAVSDAVAGMVYVAPATLMVESVSAINGLQLEVKFNKDVDEATAETEGNYKIVKNDVSTLTIPEGGVELQKDDKTVIITMDAPFHAVDKSAKLVVSVKDKAIQAEDDASEVAAFYNTVLTIKDATAPTITKITAETNGDYAQSVKIEFSEPVYAGVMKLNGSSKGSVSPLAEYVDEVTISNVELEVGKTHTIQIVNLTDAVGNVTSTTSKTFQVTEDTVVPTVKSVEQYSDNSVLVTFSKKMNESTVVSATGGYIDLKDEVLSSVGTITVVQHPDDGTANTRYIVSTNDSTLYDKKTSRVLTVLFDEGIEDSLGNELDATTKTVTLKEDT